ncbi:rhodanese-like domain-containing protein [uncultured Clostridium sp.]|uniref:rhodanese-like domain-containing protein n=1 Tax=uncultured Clostridium sp. TaxID=59620 RepID=UPI0025CC47AF|nr:rhodanese-like domain-containing protein [uncultured Clostridium sp.]
MSSIISDEMTIRADELDKVLDKINLIDIREEDEYYEGHVRGAKNIPMNDLIQDPEEYLEDSEKYYIICHSGRRSDLTCRILRDSGYNVVDVLYGTDGYPGELEID